jgi:plastocyanin
MIRIFLAAVLAGGLLAAGALRAAPAGSTVDIPHTVLDAATARTFRSKPLDTGDSFAFTFTTPGTYQYICSLHPFMKGTVVVK